MSRMQKSIDKLCDADLAVKDPFVKRMREVLTLEDLQKMGAIAKAEEEQTCAA